MRGAWLETAIVALPLLGIVALGLFLAWAGSMHERDERRECVENGGRPVEVHNAPITVHGRPWFCEGRR